jgi:hypothetical protein
MPPRRIPVGDALHMGSSGLFLILAPSGDLSTNDYVSLYGPSNYNPKKRLTGS